MKREQLGGRLYLSSIGADSEDLARRYELGFENTTFCYAANLDDARCHDDAIKQCQGFDRLWLHAPFAELTPCAIDPLVRQVTEKRYRQTLAAAGEMGISRIVFHGGFVPQVYYPQWFAEQASAFWRAFLNEVPAGMVLALENVMEPEPTLLTEVVRRVDDERLRLCLDVGHANCGVGGVPPLDWIAPMAPWLCHVHLHNNDGASDLHSALGAGNIPMERVLDTLLEACPGATFTIENQLCRPSLDWLREKGYL